MTWWQRWLCSWQSHLLMWIAMGAHFAMMFGGGGGHH